VNQGGAVQQFDDSREPNRTFTAAPGRVPIAQQQQCRPEPLSAAAQQIAGNLRNRLERGLALPRKFLLDLRQVVPNQIKKLLGG
jgi:hypothetical protein